MFCLWKFTKLCTWFVYFSVCILYFDIKLIWKWGIPKSTASTFMPHHCKSRPCDGAVSLPTHSVGLESNRPPEKEEIEEAWSDEWGGWGGDWSRRRDSRTSAICRLGGSPWHLGWIKLGLDTLCFLSLLTLLRLSESKISLANVTLHLKICGLFSNTFWYWFLA